MAVTDRPIAAEVDPSDIGRTRAGESGDDPARDLLVHIVDDAGNALIGCDVRIEREGQPARPGLTLVDGTAAFSSLAPGPLRLVSQLEGYTEDERYFPFGAPSEVRVILRRTSLIRGRAMALGVPAVGVHVLASPTGEGRRSLERAIDAVSGVQDRLHALSDSDGMFELRGVDPRKTYSLISGGSGLMTSVEIRDIRPGTDSVELELQPAYGTLIVLVDQDQRTVPRGFEPARLFPALADGVHAHATTDRAASVLAGLPAEYAVSGGSSGALIYTCDHRLSTLGPIRYSWSPTGYRSVDTVVVLQPIELGLSESRIALHRTAAGFSSVEVEFTGMQQTLRSEDLLYGSPGSLLLQPTDGDLVRGPVRESGPGHWAAAHIPFGSYSARFRSDPDGEFFWPSLDRAGVPLVVSEERAKLVVDVSGTGSIRFEFLRADGSLVLDSALMQFGRGRVDTEQSKPRLQLQYSHGMIKFLRSPCVLPFLEPRSYAVLMHQPGGFLWNGVNFAGAIVSAGEVTVVQFTSADEGL